MASFPFSSPPRLPMTISVPLDVPAVASEDVVTPELSAEQSESRDKIIEYFSQAEYRLPGIEGAEGELTEEERFWLVS